MNKEEQAHVDDITDAATALLHWFESQNIEPEDSVPILAIAMASMVSAIARAHGKSVKKTIDLAIEMMRHVTEAMQKGRIL